MALIQDRVPQLVIQVIDRRLVVPDLMSAAERQWLNDYHARVRDEIGPKLDGDDRAWLVDACRPV